MHMNKLLNVIVTVFSLFGNVHSIDNIDSNEIVIECTPNLNLYIYYNGNRTLIEDFEEELSNNTLYDITNGCIDASNVYRKNNHIIFENFYTNAKCSLVLINSSKEKQGFILSYLQNTVYASSIEINNIESLNINSSTNDNIKINTIKGDGIGKVFLNGKEIDYDVDYK